jgi:hypothetical protein
MQNPQDIHYASVFSTDQKTLKKVRELLIDFIDALHKQIEPSKSEDTYAVCLDLFRA